MRHPWRPAELLRPGRDEGPTSHHTVVRQATVTPSMSGFNAQLYARIGDWTWDAVSSVCSTDVLTARTESGDPTYLAFYYFHAQSTGAVHPYRFSFGDRIDVVSGVFAAGGDSTLTLHRLSPAGAVDPGAFHWREFYGEPRPDCLYVENFNRWIARSAPGRNRGLERSAPHDFTHEHLPTVPRQYYAPRLCVAARGSGTFRRHDTDHRPVVKGYTVRRPVDLARDFNPVGLMYFASYFSVVDSALWELWRVLGRDSATFLGRRIGDQKINYVGNVDPDDTLDVTLTLRQSRTEPLDELLDAVVRVDGRLIAVSTIAYRRPAPDPGGP
ncbi:LnmK family bifunctional acyltransferase/decarboxylase [Kitasatospora griseola]|uniref:LnmK family bifunctional acyltransferase/decarboxylase n=1 Tax=Kitasatospora griseola TaxID=2064 RepID=UPI0036DAE18D